MRSAAVPLLMLLILGFAVLVVLASVVVVLLFRHRRVTRPECGACRYPVEGLTGWRCPECGSDLRSVGIAAPGMFTPRRAARGPVLRGAIDEPRAASPETAQAPPGSA